MSDPDGQEYELIFWYLCFTVWEIQGGGVFSLTFGNKCLLSE